MLILSGFVDTWVWADAKFDRLEDKIDQVLYHLIENKPADRDQ